MKASIIKTGVLLAIAGSLAFSLQAKELKKEIHKEFTTNRSSSLSIINKFGEVVIENWDQNQVVFDIEIKAEYPDEKKAQKILDGITVEFRESNGKIRVRTKFNEQLNKGNWSKGKKFSINYTVKVPQAIPLDLDHSFGDVVINKLTGPVSLDISFGELKAEALFGKSVALDLSYSSGQIDELANATLDIAYVSGLKIGEAGKLNMNVSYSEVKVQKAKGINLDASYSDIKIGYLPKSFDEVEIDAQASDIDLGIDPDAGFTLSAEVHLGDITYPEGMNSLIKNTKKMNQEVTGTYGKGRSSISVDANLSDIKIFITK